MITSVRIKNFKNIRDQEIDLERLTVFVGPNGSGKTSVLEAVHRVQLRSSEKPNLYNYERHLDWIYSRGGQGPFSIVCTSPSGDFSVRAIPPVDFPPPLDKLGTSQWVYEYAAPSVDEAGIDISPDRFVIFLRMNAAELAKPSFSSEDKPQMRIDGEGLASVLAYLALYEGERFQNLTNYAKLLIPRLQRIKFRPSQVRKTELEMIRFGNEVVERRIQHQYPGHTLLFDFDHADDISASTLSDGTLLMLGFLTFILGPTRPRILLIDDIDHALHPLAQKTLLEVLAIIMAEFPDLQILATSHSPYLLHHLQPEQVRIMTTDANGYAICGKLSQHPKFAKWKDEMNPGEMWSLFGEKWLTEPGVVR